MTAAPEPLTRKDPLWAELAFYLRWLASLFGEPGGIAEEQAMRRERGLMLRGWLRALEAMARALLVVLAVRDFPEVAPSHAKRKRQSTDENPNNHQRGLQSERWIDVRFTLLPRERSTPGGWSNLKSWRSETMTTRALAFRFEALIRVAETPARYAKRMARLLRARPGAETRILAPPPDERGDVRTPFPVRDVLTAQREARAALAIPDSG